MNLNDHPTIEQFHDLLRQHDDRAGHHVLWVRKDGEVLLTCLPNEKPYRVPTYEHPDMQMRYDTFPIGYGYVGPESLEDGWFMGEVFKNMFEQWARVKASPGMTHIDLATVAPDGRPVDAEEAAEIGACRKSSPAGSDPVRRNAESARIARISEQETSLAHSRDV